jgi:hypothetical protein
MIPQFQDYKGSFPYKTDSKKLSIIRRDNSSRQGIVTEKIGKRLDTTAAPSAPVQIKISPDEVVVDSRLKSLTSDLPRRDGIGYTAIAGDLKGDASFVTSEVSVDAPRVDFLPDTSATSSGIGRDGNGVQFAASTDRRPVSTSAVRAHKKDGTSMAPMKLQNASKFSGASRPVRTLTIETFEKDADAGIDYRTDLVLARGGELAQPLRLTPSLQDGTQSRMDMINSRQRGEFQKR